MITIKFHIQKRMIQAIRDPGFKLSLPPGGEASNRVLLRPAISQHENKDLEFIGDSAIGLSATMALHKKYPKRLSPFVFDIQQQLRSVLVSNRTFFHLMIKAGLAEEAEYGSKWKSKWVADAFETRIGSYFLDNGSDSLSTWFSEALGPLIAACMAAFLEFQSDPAHERKHLRSDLESSSDGRVTKKPKTTHVYEGSSTHEDRWYDVPRASHGERDEERANDVFHREVRPLPRRTTVTSPSASAGVPSCVPRSTYPCPWRPLQPCPNLSFVPTGASANTTVSRSAYPAPNRRPLQDVRYSSRENLGLWRSTVDLSARKKLRLADRPRERLSWERPLDCSWAPKLREITPSPSSKVDLLRSNSTGITSEPPSPFSFIEMSHLLETIISLRRPSASSHAHTISPASNTEVSSYAASSYWADSPHYLRSIQLHVDSSFRQTRIASDQLCTGSGDMVGGSDPWLDSRFNY